MDLPGSGCCCRWPQPLRPLLGAPIRYGESRPEFYDFDLFHQPGQTPELDHTPLAELTYTVFDTETTGLHPSGGDEIICHRRGAHRQQPPAPRRVLRTTD